MQDSTVPCQTGSHTVRKQTWLLIWQWSVMKRKQRHLKFPMNEVKESHKTNTYVAWQCFCSLINVTFSCPCAHHDGIWERGGTTQHITNPAPLHTVPSDDILATIWNVNLPFSPQDFISYQMEQVTLSLNTSLGTPVCVGYMILA
jgi:hypothetical protein